MTGWSVLMSEIAPSTTRPPATGFSPAPVGAADSCVPWGACEPHAVATSRAAPRMDRNRLMDSLLATICVLRPIADTSTATERFKTAGAYPRHRSGASEFAQAKELLEGADDVVGPGVAARPLGGGLLGETGEDEDT